MKDITAKSLYDEVTQTLKNCVNTPHIRNYVGDKMNLFTWEAYGKRYDSFLKNISIISHKK